MNLIKTSLLNGVSVVVKMVSALFLNKILAVYVGPSGYAVIGQFQNAISIITTFASGAINTGVTKYTAEYHDNEELQHKVWRTASTISLVGAVVGSVAIALLNRFFASKFLGTPQYGSIFVWFAASLTLFVFNSLLLAILNGRKEIRKLVVANITGSFVSVIFTSLLAWHLGLYGALLAFAINQSVVFVATMFLCRGASWFRIPVLFGTADKQIVRNLARFTLMAVTSACTVPVSQIVIRNHLINTFGPQSAGQWQAMCKISEMYLMLITATLSVYYLPRISEIKSGSELRGEILKGYQVLLPLTMASAAILYMMRDWIISILFTAKFEPMRILFGWQLTGDVIKIASWLLAYVMVGHAMTRAYLITEVMFGILLVTITYVFTYTNDFVGVSMAYAVSYIFYLLIVTIIVSKRIKQLV